MLAHHNLPAAEIVSGSKRSSDGFCQANRPLAGAQIPLCGTKLPFVAAHPMAAFEATESQMGFPPVYKRGLGENVIWPFVIFDFTNFVCR